MSARLNIPGLTESVKDFSLPKYNEIPNVGLYLEQVSKYITEIFEPIEQPGLTGSMISNYVKKKLIPNPVKKLYYREQIAYLVFITVAKQALSIGQIKDLIDTRKESFEVEALYNYFLSEFESVFGYVFGISEEPEDIVEEDFGKLVLRQILLNFAYQAFLDKTLALAGVKRSDE
ncbi:MAG: DUF1836 domain-containing protein [Firmicutes bacterium]|nr:DUF1836 domain-containing protein [Bacillota bacterium]